MVTEEKVMEIYTYLKQDHEKVAKLFEKIISARSSHSRESLFEELNHELLVHSQVEQAIFYKSTGQSS